MRIELRGLKKTFKGTRALDGVSFSVEPGQIIAALGANGSGKTTLLRCMAGITVADRGEILYDEHPFNRDDIELRRRLFFMADFPYCFWEMTPLQHIGMCLKVYGAQRPGVEAMTVELLRDFDLLPLADAPLVTLSRGLQYKAALCALFLVDAELWLIDEPFASGMDPQGMSVFKRRVRDAAARGRTIIYSTQILEIVERFSDRVCVLHEGEARAIGRFEEIYQRREDAALDKIFASLRETP